MISQFKRLFKHSFIYAIGSLAQGIVGFILIPLYTRYLSPASYGQLEIINTLILISTMILSLGFASALLKCHERDCRGEKEQKQLIGTAFLFIIPFSTFVTILAWFFSKSLARILLGGEEFLNLIYLLLLINIFAVFLSLAFAVLRMKERSIKFVIFSLSKFALVLGLNIYFVAFLHLDIFGILLGNFISQIVIVAPFIFTLISYANFKFSKKLLRSLFAFGIPIIPASLAMWIMDLSDRYFLKFYVSMTEVGLYSLGYKIGFVVSILIVVPFQLAWPTVSFSVSKRSDTKEIYARTLTYLLFIGCFMALAISIFSKQIVEIMSASEYLTAYKVVPLIAFSYVLYAVHFAIVPGLHLREKTKLYPLLVIVPAVLNLILNYIFIPKYGMMAAAWSTFACFVFMALMTYLVSNYFYKVKYEWGRIVKLVVVSCVLLVVSYVYQNLGFWAVCSLNILILIVFVGLLFLLRFFRKGELQRIGLLLKKS